MKRHSELFTGLSVIILIAALLYFINSGKKPEEIKKSPSPIPSTVKEKKPPMPVIPPKYTNIYNDICEAGDGKVYFVGNRGAFLCYDGQDYKSVNSGTTSDLYTVSSAGTKIYIGGRNGYFACYDGNKINPIKIPFEGKILSSLAIDDQNIYLCGSYGCFFHYNGKEVKKIETGVNVFLSELGGNSAGQIYITGKGLVLKYDGKKCKEQLVLKEQTYLRSVYVESENCILVCGENGTIMKNDGKKWKTLQKGTRQHFVEIAKLKDEFYICDQSGNSVKIEKNDKISQIRESAGKSINAVIALSNGKMVATGEEGLIAVYSDGKWERAKIGPPIQDNGKQQAIGRNENVTNRENIEKSNDVRKKGIICCIPPSGEKAVTLKDSSNEIFFTIYGNSDSDILAAGKDGISYHYNGKDWKKLESSNNLNIYKVICFSPTDYYAVCSSGVIKKYNGKKWTTEYSFKRKDKSAPNLFGIWGSSKDNIYAVGEQHTILHYDGKEWNRINIPVDRNGESYLYSVWGLSKSDIYFVGDLGIIYHFDGKSFTKLNIPTKNWLTGIWGKGRNNLYVIGEDGTFFHYNGSAWKDVSIGRNCIFDIIGLEDGSFYTAGFGNIVVKQSKGVQAEILVENCKFISDIWISPSQKVYGVGEGR